MERRGKMSAPLTSCLSVEVLSQVIDIKYGCFTFFPIKRNIANIVTLL